MPAVYVRQLIKNRKSPGGDLEKSVKLLPMIKADAHVQYSAGYHNKNRT